MTKDSEKTDLYQSPFSGRYASQEMGFIFSDDNKYSTYRKLWYELARIQKKLGLAIPEKALEEMKKHLHNIDYERVTFFEKKFRHDVMAHIHAFGENCPEAAPIIHLGATSCYVTDNTDLILMRDGLKIIRGKLLGIIRILTEFAKNHAHIPCVSFTHFQPAQPTTVGKRASLWLQDFHMDLLECDRLIHSLPFLGAKGATGTQSSFLTLFEGNHKKINELDELLAEVFGFQKFLTISGQTYSRKVDIQILNTLESFAASASKCASDIRLLSHLGEIKESFSKKQVGSSAMPHKQNPIYSERICSISRFLISLSQNPSYTTATQWLERSLDDSANRRIVNPQAFLAADSILNLIHHVFLGLSIDTKNIQTRFEEEIPKLVMENIMMHATRKGGDRQKLHEKLREIAQSKFEKEKITKDPDFYIDEEELEEILKPEAFIGRSPEQTLEFIEKEVKPSLNKFKDIKSPFTSVQV